MPLGPTPLEEWFSSNAAVASNSASSTAANSTPEHENVGTTSIAGAESGASHVHVASLAHSQDARASAEPKMGKSPKRKGSSTVDNPSKRQKTTNAREESTAGGPSNPEHQSTGGQGKGFEEEGAIDASSDDLERVMYRDNHLARLGLLNTVRIAARSNREAFSHMIRTRHGGERAKDGDFVQDMEAQQLESFFMELRSGTPELTWADAHNRLRYVEHYMKTPKTLKDWRKLSLIMRLNLIESLVQIEKVGDLVRDKALSANAAANDREDWKELQDKVRNTKIDCMRAQGALEAPKNWKEYDERNDTSRVDPDEPLRTRPQASSKSTTTRREPAAPDLPKKRAVSTKPGTKKPAPEKKSIEPNLDPEPTPWTDEQKKFFDTLLVDKEQDSDKPEGRTASTRATYKLLEIDFCKKFVKAKNESGAQKWGANSDAMKALSRAHRRWFIKCPLPAKEGEAEVVPYRAPHAMYRKLCKDEPFKMLFKAKAEEKAESSKAPATSTKEAKKNEVKKAKPTKAAVSQSSTGSTKLKVSSKKDGKASKPKQPDMEPIAEEDDEPIEDSDSEDGNPIEPDDDDPMEPNDEEDRGNELSLDELEEDTNKVREEQAKEEEAKKKQAKKEQAKKGKAKELPIEVSDDSGGDDSDDDESDGNDNDNEPGAERNAAGHPTTGEKQPGKKPPGAVAEKNAAGHPTTARKGAPKSGAGEKVAEVDAVPECPIEGEEDEGEGGEFEGEEDAPRGESNDESDDSTEASEED